MSELESKTFAIMMFEEERITRKRCVYLLTQTHSTRGEGIREPVAGRTKIGDEANPVGVGIAE
jgi:hypothetical protein